MSPKTKYLSCFRNNTLSQEKKPSISTINLLGHIGFSFVIVILLSFSLRLIEDTLTKQPFSRLMTKTVLAAELSNGADAIYQSHTKVNIKPDQSFTFTLKYKNIGTTTWTKEKVYLKSSTTALKFKHKFWPDPYLPAQLKEKEVLPGQEGSFIFALQAPSNLNNYLGDFLLVNDNVLISGGNIQITMNVVNNPEQYQETPPVSVYPILGTIPPIAANTPPKAQICTLKLKLANALDKTDNATCVMQFGLPAQGPMIRVGLFYTEKSISIKNNQAWQVYDQTDTLLASVPAEQIITFYYINANGEYAFDFIDKTIRTSSYLKLKNFNNGLFTITSLVDSPSWNPSINYNDFIGDLEIRYNNSKKRTWLIETLPLEEYVQGIKETSNSDPLEYLKTMAVAARTYALYHYNKGTKHADEFFHVEATYDQVYKGQVTRIILPNHKKAVIETSGIVATYNDELIVAAYFSRGDGRTRSFKEVWKSEVPYLQSVETIYTKNKELWGHGVGIDATDALNRAAKDNWTYDQLLKYYYTGIYLEKIY